MNKILEIAMCNSVVETISSKIFGGGYKFALFADELGEA